MSKKKGEKKDKSVKKKEPVDYSSLAPVLSGAARSLRTVLSRNLADAGLYAGQDGVILLLAEGAMTPGQLAQRLGVKAPTMTRTVGRMEAQGFVSRKPDGEDGRAVKVHLTETGHQSVERIRAAIEASAAQALEGFSDKEIRNMVKLLRSLTTNLTGVEIPVAEGDETD